MLTFYQTQFACLTSSADLALAESFDVAWSVGLLN
jgi:hypothetical protein